MTQSISTTQLATIAGITLQQFITDYNNGTNHASTYYTELAAQGAAINNDNIENYAKLAKDVTTNTGVNGKLANEYSAAAAARDSVSFSVGSSDWLEVQFELMQRDLTARQDEVTAGKSGELDYAETNTIHSLAFDSVDLPPETYTLYTPTNELGNADPALAQALFEDMLVDAGLGDNALLDLLAIDILNDWADTTSPEYYRWLGNVATALKNDPSIVPAAVATEFQDFLDALPSPLGIAPWLDGLGSQMEKALPPWIQDVLDPYSNAQNLASPLVLDLDGDGIELAALNNPGSVFWDVDLDGFAEASGWISGGDGLLAIDLDADGVINDHGELFGDQTGSNNGFAALSIYDTNTDGSITSADTQFSDLRVWIDSNADGYSQSGELHTLSSLNITSFDLDYTNVDYVIAGNEIKQESTFTINGQSRKIVDAWFSYSNTNSSFVQSYDLDVRTLFLPNLRGYGELKDLNIAMSLDKSGAGNLFSLVEDLATTTAETLFDPDTDLYGTVKEIIYRWAGADVVDPTSRGEYFNAQNLTVLEKLTGDDYLQNGIETDPWLEAGRPLQQAFDAAMDALSVRLLMQSPMASIFSDTPAYNPVLDGFEGTYALDVSKIETIVQANDDTFSDLAMVWYGVLDFIDKTQGLANLSPGDETALDTAIQNSDITNALDLAYFETALTQNGTVTGDANANILFGTDTATSLNGEGGNDILISGPQNTQMYGGTGDDTYIITSDFGSDSWNSQSGLFVSEQTGEGTDSIEFQEGLSAADARIWIGDFGNLYIQFGDVNANEKITISSALDYLDGSDIGNRIEQIKFADATTWDLTNGTTQKDTNDSHQMHGTSHGDSLDGRGGADTLFGYGGDDVLTGGSGIDVLDAGTGNDTLKSSAGADILYGREGADTFAFLAQDGFDGIEAIQDFDLSEGDSLDVTDILSSTYNPSIHNITDFIQITDVGSTSTLKIDQDGGANNFVSVATLHGVTGLTDEQALLDNANLIFAESGNTDPVAKDDAFTTDQGTAVSGNLLSDNGSGSDSDADLDTLSVQARTFNSLGGALVVLSTNGSFTYTPNSYFNGVDSFDYIVQDGHGGRSFGTATITVNAGSTGTYNNVIGSASSETLNGTIGADLMDGLGGNDRLYGNAGNDKYLYGSGDGNDRIYDTGGTEDLIEFEAGISQDDIRLWNSNIGDLYVYAGSNYLRINDHFDNTGEEIEAAIFSDGSSLGLLENLTFTGTSSGNEYVYGRDDDNTLIGMQGGDRIYGYAGDDTYYWETGHGNDNVYDSAGANDKIKFGTGITLGDIRLWYSNFDLYVYKGAEYLRIHNQFDNIGEEIETAIFADGSSLDLINNLTFTGTSSAETVYALGDDNTLVGLGGSDNLYGYGGNDAYYWETGHGNDRIYDSGGINDKIEFGLGITQDDIRLWQSNNDLYVYIDSAYLRINNQFDDVGEEIESAIFADGSLMELVNNLTFTGTSGNESIYALSDDNTLVGLTGNDNLYGYAGNDTYYWETGHGNDRIYESGNGNDKIEFGAGITQDDVRFWNSANDLYVYIGSNYLRIHNQFDNLGEEVETALFSDGSSIDLLNNLTFSGTIYNDSIYAVNDNNTVFGDAGNDTLYGYDGSDVLYGGTGVDNLHGGNGSDTFAWESGDTAGVSDTIHDFNESQGDKFDISDLLTGYDPLTDAITDFVHITSNGTHSYLRIDGDGGGNNFQQIAQISYATGLTDEEALETAGTLITV